MRSGCPVIVQADLKNDNWRGRADVLIRVDVPSQLGSWSYEVVDTKLARKTRGGTILQLSVYSELVRRIQGVLPEFMHVVKPASDYIRETFRTNDYSAYYRFIKHRFDDAIVACTAEPYSSYTFAHCDICCWWAKCNTERRMEDHLSFVAGILKLQTGELRKHDIRTLASLANLPLPIAWRPTRGSTEGFTKIREQARVQLQRRNTNTLVWESLPFEAEHGLARLPEPSTGDVFLDLEADPFVEPNGIEYLIGYVTLADNQPQYYSL
jgi:uncharacterized protein